MQITQLLAVAGLAGSLYAQVNPFVFYPQDPERQALTCTSFVARPNGNQAAEALLEIDPQHFRGVGEELPGRMRVYGIYHWLADERLSTPETYSVVVRLRNAIGPGPDMVGFEIMSLSNLTSPPSTNPARGTWILNEGFPRTVPVFAPADQRLYFGVSLPANPLWPATDGHSLFRADLTSAGTTALVGENHRAVVPNPTWAGLVAQPSFSTPWTYVLGPFVRSPNLHVGGIDPTSNRLGAPGANLSMNGLWPDISGQPRRDGLLVRVTDNITPFAVVGIGVSTGFVRPYQHVGLVPFGVLFGVGHIGGPGAPPVVIGLGALQNGACDLAAATPGSIPVAMLGTDLVVQGIIWDVNTSAAWTNAQAVHF